MKPFNESGKIGGDRVKTGTDKKYGNIDESPAPKTSDRKTGADKTGTIHK